MSVNIFFCYAHEDEPLLKKLKLHLMPLQQQGLINLWYDRDISAGVQWEQEIGQRLDSAQIILLLVSPDFMASDYINYVEMKRALERHKSGEARVIPIILRPTHWQGVLFGQLQALPTDAIPATDPYWHDLDSAFYDVTEGIHKVVEEINRRSQPTIPALPEPLKVSPPSSFLRHHPKVNTVSKVVLIVAVVLIVLAVIVKVIQAPHTLGRKIPSSTPSPSIVATNNANDTATASATVANSNPYGGKLVLVDPLHDNSMGYGWSEFSDNKGGCQFTGGAYHASEIATSLHRGCNASPDFSNLAFEVQMTIIKGDAGGIAFRVHITPNDTDDTYYMFFVNQHGTYSLFGSNPSIQPTFSSAIHQGLGQTNIIAVVAKGSLITLYVNHQKLVSLTDSSYSHGLIGVVASDDTQQTEVAYSNAKVWTL